MSGADVAGLFAGTHTFLVGVEDEPTGGIRVYLRHRSEGIYAVIDDVDAIDEVRSTWRSGGHVVIPCPPADCIYCDRPPESS